ncbi:hypothetical protein, partial [Chromohalobacter sp. HP20-39]
PPHWDEPLSPLCEHGNGYSCKHCREVLPFPTEPLPHQTGHRPSGSKHIRKVAAYRTSDKCEGKTPAPRGLTK